MEIRQITLKEFRKELSSSFFEDTYRKLQLDIALDEIEKLHLLKNAIVFSNYGDVDI